MLAEVLERGSATAVVADILRAGRRVPGLGHQHLSRRRPARPRAVHEAGAGAGWRRRAGGRTRGRRDGAPGADANIDLALAVLTLSSGMAPEAGEAVFAVARTAGWIAHALEEYEERPLRLRPSGHYTGPRPPRPLPSPVSEA